MNKINKLVIFGIALIIIGLGITLFLFVFFIGVNENADDWHIYVTEMGRVPAYAMVVGGIVASIIGLSLDRIEENKNEKKKMAPQIAPNYQQLGPPPYNP